MTHEAQSIACLLALVVSTACRRDSVLVIKGDPAIEGHRDPVAPVLPPSPELAPKLVNALVGHVGDEVTIEGTLTRAVHAHLTKTIAGKGPLYVSLAGSPGQIVAYVAEVPECPAAMRLSGKVFVLAGTLGGGPTGAAYAEPQLDVDRIRCVGSSASGAGSTVIP